MEDMKCIACFTNEYNIANKRRKVNKVVVNKFVR